jgi:hypothetical protein
LIFAAPFVGLRRRVTTGRHGTDIDTPGRFRAAGRPDVAGSVEGLYVRITLPIICREFGLELAQFRSGIEQSFHPPIIVAKTMIIASQAAHDCPNYEHFCNPW